MHLRQEFEWNLAEALDTCEYFVDDDDDLDDGDDTLCFVSFVRRGPLSAPLSVSLGIAWRRENDDYASVRVQYDVMCAHSHFCVSNEADVHLSQTHLDKLRSVRSTGHMALHGSPVFSFCCVCDML